MQCFWSVQKFCSYRFLYARPNGSQEVAGSIPTTSTNVITGSQYGNLFLFKRWGQFWGQELINRHKTEQAFAKFHLFEMKNGRRANDTMKDKNYAPGLLRLGFFVLSASFACCLASARMPVIVVAVSCSALLSKWA